MTHWFFAVRKLCDTKSSDYLGGGSSNIFDVHSMWGRFPIFQMDWNHQPDTPWKINMVHLQITHLERKMIWTKPPWGHVPAVNLQGWLSMISKKPPRDLICCWFFKFTTRARWFNSWPLKNTTSWRSQKNIWKGHVYNHPKKVRIARSLRYGFFCLPFPYHPCMVYVPTFGWFLWFSCR